MHATFLWHFYSFSCSFQGSPKFTSQLSTFDKHNLRNPLREAVIGESNQEAHAVFPAPWLSFLGDPVKSWNACVSLPAKHSDECFSLLKMQQHHLLRKVPQMVTWLLGCDLRQNPELLDDRTANLYLLTDRSISVWPTGHSCHQRFCFRWGSSYSCYFHLIHISQTSNTRANHRKKK